jgi:hypothetical protein
MSVLQPIIKNVIGSVLNGVFSLNPILSAIRKTYIDLSPTSGGFYSLSTAWTAANDFEIELDFVISNSTTFNMLLGKAGQSSPWIGVDSSGKISAPDLIKNPSNLSYDDGLLHTLKITRVGGVIGLFVDETQAISDANYSGTLEFDLIGDWNNGGFSFDGIISNVKLTNITTPANSLEFKLDELTQNYELPDDNVYGPELWDYGVINADGTTNQFSVIAGDFTDNYDDDGLYEVLVTWENLTGKIRFNAGNDNYTVGVVSNNTGSASFAMKFLAGTAGRLNVTEIMPDDEDGSTADSITMSVRKVSAFVEYQNIPEDVRNTYVLSNGGTQLISDLRTIDIAAQA